MTLDASGNLLVGTTDPIVYNEGSTGNSGVVISSDNYYSAARKNGPTLFLNRQASDGAIAQFYKDGTTVGSIGSSNSSSVTYLAGSASGGGIGVANNSPAVFPARPAGVIDDTINLGSGFYRFKDLYLSGGVYLGGVASANKLDDYEEGTWTPSLTTGTATFQSGRYTKVGRLVTCHFIVSGFSDRTSTNQVLVGNLPFTAESGDSPVVAGVLGQYISVGSITGCYLNTTTQIAFYITSSGAYTALKHNNLTSVSSGMYVAFSYMAA